MTTKLWARPSGRFSQRSTMAAALALDAREALAVLVLDGDRRRRRPRWRAAGGRGRRPPAEADRPRADRAFGRHLVRARAARGARRRAQRARRPCRRLTASSASPPARIRYSPAPRSRCARLRQPVRAGRGGGAWPAGAGGRGRSPGRARARSRSRAAPAGRETARLAPRRHETGPSDHHGPSEGLRIGVPFSTSTLNGRGCPYQDDRISEGRQVQPLRDRPTSRPRSAARKTAARPKTDYDAASPWLTRRWPSGCGGAKGSFAGASPTGRCCSIPAPAAASSSTGSGPRSGAGSTEPAPSRRSAASCRPASPSRPSTPVRRGPLRRRAREQRPGREAAVNPPVGTDRNLSRRHVFALFPEGGMALDLASGTYSSLNASAAAVCRFIGETGPGMRSVPRSGALATFGCGGGRGALGRAGVPGRQLAGSAGHP